MGLFARCHCVDSLLRQLHVIPFINHFPDYLISALVAEVEVLAITGATGSSEQLLGEDDMRQLEELRQATMATYSDGSPVKWEGGGQLTWQEWAEWLQKQQAKDKDKLAAEKAAAVEQATAAAKAEYDARLEKEMEKLKVGHDKEIQELKNKHQKELLAFFPTGLPIKWTFGPKNGQQMTKDERIGYLDNLLGKYERKCNDSEGRLKLAKDLFMSTLDLNFLKAVLDILALAKAGAKALTKGLMEFLLMTMKAMDTLERRQKHVERAFQYVRIFAAMEGLNYSENYLAPPLEKMPCASSTAHGMSIIKRELTAPWRMSIRTIA